MCTMCVCVCVSVCIVVPLFYVNKCKNTEQIFLKVIMWPKYFSIFSVCTGEKG